MTKFDKKVLLAMDIIAFVAWTVFFVILMVSDNYGLCNTCVFDVFIDVLVIFAWIFAFARVCYRMKERGIKFRERV